MKVTQAICENGLMLKHILWELISTKMTDQELAEVVERVTVLQIVTWPKAYHSTVKEKWSWCWLYGRWYINDAPSMKVADVGVSVDTGVDIAPKKPGCCLLYRGDLMVLKLVSLEGRKV